MCVCECVSHLPTPLELTMTNWSLCLIRTLECHLGQKSQSHLSLFFSFHTMKEICLKKKKKAFTCTLFRYVVHLSVSVGQIHFPCNIYSPVFKHCAGKHNDTIALCFSLNHKSTGSHAAVAGSCTTKSW